jgi:hypothetical protein
MYFVKMGFVREEHAEKCALQKTRLQRIHL